MTFYKPDTQCNGLTINRSGLYTEFFEKVQFRAIFVES